MVVSRDWQEVSVLECILGGLHIDVVIENQPQRALARLSKSKVDALIVDCDLSGTTQFLREMQRDQRRTNPVPLVIMRDPPMMTSGTGFVRRWLRCISRRNCVVPLRSQSTIKASTFDLLSRARAR